MCCLHAVRVQNIPNLAQKSKKKSKMVDLIAVISVSKTNEVNLVIKRSRSWHFGLGPSSRPHGHSLSLPASSFSPEGPSPQCWLRFFSEPKSIHQLWTRYYGIRPSNNSDLPGMPPYIQQALRDLQEIEEVWPFVRHVPIHYVTSDNWSIEVQVRWSLLCQPRNK